MSGGSQGLITDLSCLTSLAKALDTKETLLQKKTEISCKRLHDLEEGNRNAIIQGITESWDSPC